MYQNVYTNAEFVCQSSLILKRKPRLYSIKNTIILFNLHIIGVDEESFVVKKTEILGF